jgi:peptide/nickel transport system substrate-binding protein
MYTKPIRSGVSKPALLGLVVLLAIIFFSAAVLLRPVSHSSSSTSSISTQSLAPPTTETASSLTTQVNSTETASGPANTSQLVVLETSIPNSIDPATGFFSGEDEVMTNVYQGLVLYNYTSFSVFAPILASNWTVSSTYTNYTFMLRPQARFADGDSFNSSTVWFNFYRDIVMNQAGASYFTNLLYNGSQAFSTGYALPWGAISALQSVGYQFSNTNSTLRQVQAAQVLATILSNFDPSNKTVMNIMDYPNQAVVVLSNYEVVFNLINPYINFLQVLATPGAFQVDPLFVDQHGGVEPNQQNTYLNTRAMGTGPYQVKSYVQGQVLTMVQNMNYWVKNLPSSQMNIMLTQPRIPVIIIEYETSASQLIQGIKSNFAALLGGPPIPALSVTDIPSVMNYAGVDIVSLPNAAKFLFLMAVFDTEQYPYNITGFREAVAHAINYTQIISSVTNGYGEAYVGPISPGLPYYNPNALEPYTYNPSYSIQLLGSLGFRLDLPNGTIINPNGAAPHLSITYISSDAAEAKAAQEIQIMLSQVGLQFGLNPITSSTLFSSISQPGTALSYPGFLLWYWFPSWLDPVYQDLVVQTNVQYGGIAGDVSWFNNSLVNNLTSNIVFQTNPSVINRTVAQVYNIVYSEVPDVWLYALVPYWVQRSYLSGVIYNPGILGFYYPLMYYNTP